MKVLFVSRFVDPFPIGGNKNVFLQAKTLIENYGVDVEVLTWPQDDFWTGEEPPVSSAPDLLEIEREGIKYHVFKAPAYFDVPAGGAILSDADWEEAVELGERFLDTLKPDIVHLQHRHGLWWILESAQRMSIPTVYSNHDWGIPCMRTILVMGDNQLCDGIVEVQKCSSCITSGRSSLLGRLNERLVTNVIGETLAKAVITLPLLGDSLRKRGLVTLRAESRTSIHSRRAKRVMRGLAHCFTPSEFGKKFFSRFGVSDALISVLPWYHDPVDQAKCLIPNQSFTITYIGRVSPEKGVGMIFSALEALNNCEPILLRIVGSNDMPYCSGLKEKYPTSVGIHAVEWVGWAKIEPFFKTTDVTILPSQWIDNTPLSLIEALAYRTPVIATRVPPVEELLLEGETGFLATYGSVSSLMAAIERAIRNKVKIRSQEIVFPEISGINQYMREVVRVYRAIMKAVA